jgi:hypothetical protein
LTENIHPRKPTRGMDGSVAQDKNVCGTCGVKFTRHQSLRKYERTQHPDNPEAVAKHLKRQEETNTSVKQRRSDDPVFREKMRYRSQMNRMNKKACVEACAAGGVDVAASSVTDKKAEKETEADVDPFMVLIDSMDVSIARAEEEMLVRQAILYASRGGKANPKWRKSPARKDTVGEF